MEIDKVEAVVRTHYKDIVLIRLNKETKTEEVLSKNYFWISDRCASEEEAWKSALRKIAP